jgi:uncharacterized protein (TIGR02270 family)
MTLTSRSPVPIVVQQHAEDAASLRNTRSVLVRAPHVRLPLLHRLDDRLAAHLDGLAVAGPAGREICVAALESVTSGTVFAAAVLALETGDAPLLERLLAVVEAQAQARPGLVSAFGWVPASSLRGITKGLLDSPVPFRREMGLAACAMHQVVPGPALGAALTVAQPSNVAVSVAAVLGQREHLPSCLRAAGATDPGQRFAAARAALLLGERELAIRALTALALDDGNCRNAALPLLIKALAPEATHGLLKPLSRNDATSRLLVRSVGIAGDPHYTHWLIQQMSDPKLTRLAGEAFSTMTGLDLAYLDLDRKPPDGVVSGPGDDPAEADVALDEDESLPWPDVDKISAWWHANGARFQPGTRYFVGEPPSVAHCVHVLKHGFQRQRIAAAEYLCLLQPGTPLFNVAAPAWRQERLLAQMGV